MTNCPLGHRTLKRMLFIISTCKVCLGSTSMLDRPAYAMIWCQDEKDGFQIFSWFNFQQFKRFLGFDYG